MDLSSSVTQNSYLGLHTLPSYDVAGCSALCDSTALCTSFNLYVERDPSLNPAPACPNPSSITNYKCTLWGSGTQPASATNSGEKRDLFDVVIAGSNVYDKTNNTTPSTPTGLGAPQRCLNGALNNPAANLGTKFFALPYDLYVVLFSNDPSSRVRKRC